jgi:hypothetical protein
MMTTEYYQAFVLSTRFPSADPYCWARKSADYIEGERLEVLEQHGPGDLLLTNPYMPNTTELRYKVGDELSDLFWFGGDITNWLGEDIAMVCTDALSVRLQRQLETTSSFAELQDRAVVHSREILLPHPDMAGESTTLAASPVYGLIWAVNNLSEALRVRQARESVELILPGEPDGELRQALGDYFNCLMYVAKDGLLMNAEDIIEFNMAKLEYRQAHGKAHDLQFQDWAWSRLPASEQMAMAACRGLTL